MFKQCIYCKEWKPTTEFYKAKFNRDGLEGRCKFCRRFMGARPKPPGKKRCSRCKEWKALGDFYSNKSNVSGLASMCIPCEKTYLNKRRSANLDKARQCARQHYANYKDVHKRAIQKYTMKHPERVRAQRAAYKAKNRPLQVAMYHNRKARRLAGGTYTVVEWEELKARYAFHCLCCGRKEPEIKLTVDHVVPLSMGGSNRIENIQPLCLSCNCRKWKKHIDYRPLFRQSEDSQQPTHSAP